MVKPPISNAILDECERVTKKKEGDHIDQLKKLVVDGLDAQRALEIITGHAEVVEYVEILERLGLIRKGQ